MPRSRTPAGPEKTAFVVLEYCGGDRTDALYRKLAGWNKDATIYVLDNASPTNRAKSATHRNRVNSYVGGGIRECIELAESMGASYVFYCANDVNFQGSLDIATFQRVMDDDPSVVLFSCSLTADSHQARVFPWMVQRAGGSVRQVRAIDPLCCLMRLDFIRGFGGFPESRGGWGFSAELAFHARTQGKKIYVSDTCAVGHTTAGSGLVGERGAKISKATEAAQVYANRYGSIDVIRDALEPPDFDETRDVELTPKMRAPSGTPQDPGTSDRSSTY
ncbi:MAG: hypothetical protein ABI672_15800 [Vicinamibacteria bacterium]